MHSTIGRILIIAGIAILVIGFIIYFAGDKLSWLGKLPGDIRIEKEHFRLYIPITTMILLSILASLIIFIIKKLF